MEAPDRKRVASVERYKTVKKLLNNERAAADELKKQIATVAKQLKDQQSIVSGISQHA